VARKTGGANKSLIPILIAGAVVAVGVGAWALISGGGDEAASTPVVQPVEAKPEPAKKEPKADKEPARTRERPRERGRSTDRARTPTVGERDDREEDKKPDRKKKKKKKKKKEPDKPLAPPGV
jgi:hypothetical protein